MEAVGKLTRAQAIILADQALTELGRTAARTAATEAVTGSYDALEKKYPPPPPPPGLLRRPGRLVFVEAFPGPQTVGRRLALCD